MPTTKTELTELATAVGLCHEPSTDGRLALDDLVVPGLDPRVWRPALEPALAVGSTQRDLLAVALDNGHAFRTHVLDGRRPKRIEWHGPLRATWTSDIPRDLTVDGVWFIQAKYDSRCVLNTSPRALVEHLAADHVTTNRTSWFSETAPAELQTYYAQVRQAQSDPSLPDLVADLDQAARATLKVGMRNRPTTAGEQAAYDELCRAVSRQTAARWRRHLEAATESQRTQMLFRMLRIAGGPYWVLGVKGPSPVRLAVMDTHSWRRTFELKRFVVTDAGVGQPQVDWHAEIVERGRSARHLVEGYCEVRWSHGKLQGHPECKVQVTTPLDRVPGYRPMGPPSPASPASEAPPAPPAPDTLWSSAGG